MPKCVETARPSEQRSSIPTACELSKDVDLMVSYLRAVQQGELQMFVRDGFVEIIDNEAKQLFLSLALKDYYSLMDAVQSAALRKEENLLVSM